MIKGLMITPPVIGRISIGKLVEKNGKRLPEKDDEFTITTQVQQRGQWVLHPLDEALRLSPVPAQICSGIQEGSEPSDLQGETSTSPASARTGKRTLKDKMGVADASAAVAPGTSRRKLRSIPVRVLFNDPDLNLRADYCMFDRTTARPVCVGNGESCKRVTGQGLEELACSGPDTCRFGMGHCKPYGRLNVSIGDGDELGSFVFRTTGFNSIRTLLARLQYFAAVSGGQLACMPLELKLRGKSTTQSHRSAIYYADLVVRSGVSLNAAIEQAHALAAERLASGFDQTALDGAARLGFANGSFEDAPDEAAEIVQEFYPNCSEVSLDPAMEAANDHIASRPPVQPRNGTHSPSP